MSTSAQAATNVDACRCRPWRSATLGWIVAILVLIAGVPLFLCMPPWNDVTLHDMAVRSMLRGGVHYRDVFDTNLPGIDWAMAGVRLAFGWSYEALRAVDIAVIAIAVGLLLGWVRRAGGTGYAVAWLAASAAMFYPFTTEFNHVQRDPWLLLPALVAARLRLLRVSLGETQTRGMSLIEGLVWGVAVWVKPHVLVPALALWVVSAVLISRREPRRRVLFDLGGLFVGGLVAGGAGIAWLFTTGAWPHFLDVFLNWNPGYVADVLPATGERLLYTFRCFNIWSLLHFAALPIALLALRDAQLWPRGSNDERREGRVSWIYAKPATESIANNRALLAAFYLGWFAQAVLLQKGFEYVQLPLLLLAMAVVATQRWAFGFAFLVWFVLGAVILNVPLLSKPARELDPDFPLVRFELHSLADSSVVELWPRCWCEGGSPEIRNRLGQYIHVHCGTNWEELDETARFLMTIEPQLGPGELNCWHDSTHPLYLVLDLEPATRYMHYGTVLSIPSRDDSIKKRIAREVAESRQRYVVSDLMRTTKDTARAYASGANGDARNLPLWFPVSQRDKFPWNQPIVFRSGRYLVHKVENPLGVIDIPEWDRVDSLGPGFFFDR